MTALAFHLPHTPYTLAFAAIAILLIAGFVAHCFHDADWVDEHEMPCDPPDAELAAICTCLDGHDAHTFDGEMLAYYCPTHGDAA